MKSPKVTKSSGSRKQAVLVLGAPRSGTSALAHLLSDMGVYFGDESAFVDSSREKHNPIFFELRRLNDLNDLILRSIGHQFDAFDYFPDGKGDVWEIDAGLAHAAKDLLFEELKGGALIGLKDPRFCFTLPFWRHVLKDLGYQVRFVLATRSQQAIIKSNKKVNREGDSYNRRLAWASIGAAASNLEGEEFATVEYDALVDEPLVVAARLGKWLGISNTDAIRRAAEAVQPELRHQMPGATTKARGAAMLDVGKVRARYLDLRGQMESSGILALLDQRRAQLTECDERVRHQAALIASLEQEKSEIVSAIQPQQSNASLAELIRPLAERVDWSSRALVEFGEHLREQVESNQRAQEQLHGEIARLNTLNAEVLHAAEATKRQLLAEVERLKEELAVADADRRQTDSELARQALHADLEKAQFDLAKRDAAFATASTRASELERDGEHLRGEIATRDAALRELGETRNALEGDVSTLRLHLASLEGRHAQLVESHGVAQSHIAEIDEARRTVEGELATLRVHVTSMEVRNSELAESLDAAQSRIDASEKHRQSLEEQLEAARQEIAGLERCNGELVDAIGSAKSQIEELGREISTQRDGFEEQRRILVAQADASDAARRQAERRAVRLMEQVRDLTEQYEAAKEALAGAQAEVARLSPPGRLRRWVRRRVGSRA